MIDRPYGELVIGQRVRSRGRTITETDVVNFCMLTGNWLEIHANTEFAANSMYGQRVVQGGLVFVIVNALFGFDSAVVEAFYGVDKLRFLKPSFHRRHSARGKRNHRLSDKGDTARRCHRPADRRQPALRKRAELRVQLLIRRERLHRRVTPGPRQTSR